MHYRNAPIPTVDQQRLIIEHLLNLDIKQTRKHEDLKVLIKESNLEIVREVRALVNNDPPASPLRSSSAPTNSLAYGTIGPMRVLEANDTKTQTIGHYCDLINNLLACVDFEGWSIDREVRTRIRNDVVEVHKRETRSLEGIYGAEDLKDAMRGKYWKLADMDGDRYSPARAMHNQSSSCLSDMAKKTAALEIAKVAETTKIKSSDAKTLDTCSCESMFGAPKELGTETSPQMLKEEPEPLRKARSGAEVSITRLSARPKRVNSEQLVAIDSTKSVPGNRSQPDDPTRQHVQSAEPYRKSQQIKLASAEDPDNCAANILDQDTESREGMLEELNPEAMLIPLLQSGIPKRPYWGGDGNVKRAQPLRRASIPLHDARQKKLDSDFDSSIRPGAGPLPNHAKSREPALPPQEVVEVPRQAVKFRPPIANAQSLPLNYAMEVFLNNHWENPVTRKEAPNAGMPAPAWYEATSPDGCGTSMMGTHSSHTRESVSTTQDLPGLTISSKGSTSSHGGLSLAEDSDTDAVTILGPVSETSADQTTADAADDAAGALECPFNHLGCLQTFAVSKAWITHSLTHFDSAEPPTINRCNFCEEQFYSVDATQSWTERMNHVARHHENGHKLHGARWNNSLYIYNHMYENGLLGIDFLCEYLGRERDRRNAVKLCNPGV